MSYIQGFVLAVPTANKTDFIRHASEANQVFMEMGATRVLECCGLDVPDGKVTDFRKAVKAGAEETVVFSWIEWPSKACFDKAMETLPEKMKTDPRMNPELNPMPFDGQRLIFGGFEPVVVLES